MVRDELALLSYGWKLIADGFGRGAVAVIVLPLEPSARKVPAFAEDRAVRALDRGRARSLSSLSQAASLLSQG